MENLPNRRASLFLLIALFCYVPKLHGQDEVDLRHLTLSTWTTAQGLPQNFILAIDQTPDGFLWIGTKGGLARFDGLNFRTSFANEIPALHSSVNGIAHDAGTADDKLTRFALRLALAGHVSIPREGEFDFLAEAVFASQPPKSKPRRNKPKSQNPSSGSRPL